MSKNPHHYGKHPNREAPGTRGILGRNGPADPDGPKGQTGPTPGITGRGQDTAENTVKHGGTLPGHAAEEVSTSRRRDPFPIPADKVGELLAPGNTSLYIGGIWGEVKNGSTWMATDGKRFVLSATSTGVIYYVGGTFYFESARGFIGEVTTYPWVEAARRSRWLVTVAETEMKLILGIIAGSSGIGFAIVVGTEIIVFILEHNDDFAAWYDQLQAILEARAYLKAHAPVLYDKLFDAVLSRVIKDVKKSIPDAITPQVLSFLVGVILGTLGKKAAKGPLSIFIVLFVVMESLVMRFVVSVVPGAVQLTKKQYEELAHEIIGKLKGQGVHLTRDEMEKIFQEVRKHPEEVKKAFKMLKDAFERMQKSKTGQHK